MTLAEALDTTRIHRVAGLTGARTAVVTTRPFRTPPHTISNVGLIGGDQVPLPGEVSLAHHGILFLDECRRSAVTSWRYGANRWRRTFSKYNLPHVLDLDVLVGIAARDMITKEAGNAR